MSEKFLFLKKITSVLLVRILGALSSLIFTFFITKNLSVNDAGIFFYIVTISIVVGRLSSKGFGTSLLRFISGFWVEKDFDAISFYLKNALKEILIFSSFVSFVFLIFHKHIVMYLYGSENVSLVYFFMGLAIPFIAIIFIIFPIFQAINKPLVSVILDKILLNLILLFIFFISLAVGVKANLFNLSIFYLVSAFIACFVGLFLLKKFIIAPHNHIKTPLAPLKKSANYIWLGLLMTTSVQYSGQIIAGAIVEPSNLSYLYVVQRISFLISFALIAVNYIAAPKFASLFKQKKIIELKELSMFCSRILFIIAIPLCALLFFLSAEILLLFGEDYVNASYLLQVLIFGQFINIICGPVAFLLNMTGNEKDMRNILLLTGSLSIILGFILTFHYGVLGAAISTSTSLIIQNLLAAFYVRKRLGFNVFNFVNY